MNSKEIRLRNVQLIIDKHCGGVRSEFARKIKKGPASIGRWWLTTENKKNIGDRAARLIEDAFNLPTDWLDVTHDNLADLEDDPHEKVRLKAQAGETHPIPVTANATLDHQLQLTIINNNIGKLMLLSTDGDAYAFQLIGHNANPLLDNHWGLVIEPNTPLTLNEYAIFWLKGGEVLLRLVVFINDQTYLVRHPITNEQLKLDRLQVEKAQYCYVGIPPSKISTTTNNTQ